MQCTGSEWNKRRHEAYVRWAEMMRKRRAESHGPYTANPNPPGSGGWDLVHRGTMEAFAAAGLCEIWRMGMEDKTEFGCHSDFPPGFCFDGIWWRKA